MHIADVKLPSSWTALATFTDVNEDDTYVIVNSSPDLIYAVEGSATPIAGVIGVPVAPGNYINYKKGGQTNLYLRNGYTPVMVGNVDTQNKVSNITINKVG
jgi:hypothetical protein